MRRDYDRLRNLLIKIEEQDDPIYECPLAADASKEQRLDYFHLLLLCDMNLLEERPGDSGLFRMTNQGHDLHEQIQSDQAWEKTRKITAQLQANSLQTLGSMTEGFARRKTLGKDTFPPDPVLDGDGPLYGQLI